MSDERELVLKRVEQTMPSDMKFLVNGEQIGKKELMEHIREGDEIGKQFVESHMDYLRSFKEGNRFGSIEKEVLEEVSE